LFLVKCNHNNNLFALQECGDFTWRASDCEELVGVAHRRWWVYSVKVTELRLFDVPEVLLSQEIPSDEVRMLPL